MVAVILVPRAARPARVVDLAPLNDKALQGSAARQNAGLVIAAEAGRRVAPAPVGNVAILDDDIVSAANFDGTDGPRLRGLSGASPLERQPADDDVGRVDNDALVMLVAHVDGRAAA